MDGFIGTRQLAESEIRANVSEQLRSGVVIFAPVLGFGSVCIVLFVLKSLTGFKLFPALGESMANAVLGGWRPVFFISLVSGDVLRRMLGGQEVFRERGKRKTLRDRSIRASDDTRFVTN